MICSLSKLDEKKLTDVQAMEQKMGRPLLAYSCHDILPAELTEQELSQLSDLEKKLGIYLVAVK